MQKTSALDRLRRLDGPTKVGLAFALLGIILTVIGIFRDPGTPVTAWSLAVGSLISGVVWGLVSWAIAVATVEVEKDLAQADGTADGEPD
ncbi:MAG: hypothetical protein D6784_10080 [Chloroflexi bacterium]|nr:MAG: hypothetical protein D6784_10080 [Chloroflexota bacterium]